MQEFNIFLEIGFKHILDLAAYDHLLFIVVLCAVYKLKQWRSVLILVTAFTIGHSITLGLAALGYVKFDKDIIEFLIPVTILLTAFYNVFTKPKPDRKVQPNYFLALIFGLIHGFGFSNNFGMLLMDQENIVVPLLGFNIGVELGQIVIVLVALGVGFLVMNIFNAKQRDWNLFISGAAAGIALILITQTDFIVGG